MEAELAELRVGGREAARGECLAAFWDGSVQVFTVCEDPEWLGEMLVRLALAVSVNLALGGVPGKKRDLLLAKVAAALAGPPDVLPVVDPDGGRSGKIAVHVEDGRVEGQVGIAALARPEEKTITAVLTGPGVAMVALLRHLAAALSLGFSRQARTRWPAGPGCCANCATQC